MSPQHTRQEDYTNEPPKSQLTGLVEKVAIAALGLIISWQQSEISKLDQRMYIMQGTAFTEEKGRALEDRLTRRLEAMSADTNSKLDTIVLLVRSKKE